MWACRLKPFRTGAVLLQRQTDPAPTVGAPASGANVGLPAETLSHRSGAPTKADCSCPRLGRPPPRGRLRARRLRPCRTGAVLPRSQADPAARLEEAPARGGSAGAG